MDIPWDVEDEVDSPFTHSTTAAPEERPIINTPDEGFIWLHFNAIVTRTGIGTNRIAPQVRLMRDPGNGTFVELDSARTSGFIRNLDGIFTGSVNLSGLYAVDDSTALKLQLRDESTSAQGFTLVTAKTGLSAAYLPDTALVVRISKQGAGQSGDTAAAISYDTTDDESPAIFTHNPVGDDTTVTVEDEGLYVFHSVALTDTRTNLNRRYNKEVFRLGGTTRPWGGHGQFDRATELDEAGSSGTILTAIEGGVDIDVFHTNDSSVGDASTVIATNRAGLFGFNLLTLGPSQIDFAEDDTVQVEDESLPRGGLFIGNDQTVEVEDESLPRGGLLLANDQTVEVEDESLLLRTLGVLAGETVQVLDESIAKLSIRFSTDDLVEVEDESRLLMTLGLTAEDLVQVLDEAAIMRSLRTTTDQLVQVIDNHPLRRELRLSDDDTVEVGDESAACPLITLAADATVQVIDESVCATTRITTGDSRGSSARAGTESISGARAGSLAQSSASTHATILGGARAGAAAASHGG